MTTVRKSIAMASVVISSAAACSAPGIIEAIRAPQGDGGTTTGAGGSAGGTGESDAGTDGSAGTDPGPCPSGYSCTDLASVGTAIDGDGKPITHCCSNGMLSDCNDANPAATCTQFAAPLCAHINVAGMVFTSCGQRCTP
jgi:hypothetical protein